ncbi:MAG: hypothetical protein ACMUIU_17540 [bacterium]
MKEKKKNKEMLDEYDSMRRSIAKMNEGGRLARGNLTKAEIMVEEAKILYEKGNVDAAEAKLELITFFIQKSRDSVCRKTKELFCC